MRQTVEDRCSPLGVLTRADLSHRLVVKQNSVVQELIISDGASFELDLVARDDPITQLCGLAVHRNVARLNALLEFSPRPKPHTREHLLKFLSIRFDRHVTHDQFFGLCV